MFSEFYPNFLPIYGYVEIKTTGIQPVASWAGGGAAGFATCRMDKTDSRRHQDPIGFSCRIFSSSASLSFSLSFKDFW